MALVLSMLLQLQDCEQLIIQLEEKAFWYCGQAKAKPPARATSQRAKEISGLPGLTVGAKSESDRL